MIAFITGNIGTILISLALALTVIAIIRKIITDKKQGKTTCGGNCASCGMCSSCRKDNDTSKIRS